MERCINRSKDGCMDGRQAGSEALIITKKAVLIWIILLHHSFVCWYWFRQCSCSISCDWNMGCNWLFRAFKSSHWQQWCSTEDWPQNISKCVWRNPHQCLSATVVLCGIRLCGALWFICRLLPYACHSLGLRLCLSRQLYIDWVSWVEKPFIWFLHGMCCPKFNIWVCLLGVDGVEWGEHSKQLLAFDHHFTF